MTDEWSESDDWLEDIDDETVDAAKEIISDRIEEEIDDESEVEEEEDELEDADDEEVIEELEDDEQEELEDVVSDSGEWSDVPVAEVHEDTHLADGNEAQDGWELVHHFDYYEDAVNYCEPVPDNVLKIIINDDGSADVYRTDYEDAA